MEGEIAKLRPCALDVIIIMLPFRYLLYHGIINLGHRTERLPTRHTLRNAMIPRTVKEIPTVAL